MCGHSFFYVQIVHDHEAAVSNADVYVEKAHNF